MGGERWGKGLLLVRLQPTRQPHQGDFFARGVFSMVVRCRNAQRMSAACSWARSAPGGPLSPWVSCVQGADEAPHRLHKLLGALLLRHVAAALKHLQLQRAW